MSRSWITLSRSTSLLIESGEPFLGPASCFSPYHISENLLDPFWMLYAISWLIRSCACCVQIRDHALLLNLGSLRAVATTEEVLVFDRKRFSAAATLNPYSFLLGKLWRFIVFLLSMWSVSVLQSGAYECCRFNVVLIWRAILCVWCSIGAQGFIRTLIPRLRENHVQQTFLPFEHEVMFWARTPQNTGPVSVCM